MAELKETLLSKRFYQKDSLNWFVFLLDVPKTHTIRTMALSTVIVAGYFSLLHYILTYHYDIEFHLPGFVTYTLGYIMIILYYFRLGTSYYRWYEGRKALSYLGASAETFAMKLSSYLGEDQNEREYFERMLQNLLIAINGHLRGEVDRTLLANCTPFVMNSQHVPNAITQVISDRINYLYTGNKISKVEFLQLGKHLAKINELLAQCDAIRKTDPPFSYLYLIRVFLVMYTLILPFGFIHDFNAWVILMLVIYFYFFTGCEIISNEIQNPFEYDQNDLPIDSICLVIRKSVKSIFEEGRV